MWGEGVSRSAEAGPNLVFLPWVEALISTLPRSSPQPLWLGLWAWDESGGGGSSRVFGFLFCSAHASRRSPLCLMSRCRVHAVAGRREGSPRVIHRQLPIHLLARVRLPGERPSPWSSPVQLRQLLESEEGKRGNQKV